MKTLLTLFSAALLVSSFNTTNVEAGRLLTIVPLASFNSATSASGKGLTWEKKPSNTSSYGDGISGVVHVGCGWGQGGVGNEDNNCNPYIGDRDCSEQLPLLCFYDAKLNKPSTLNINSYYREWSGGIVATTEPVAGSSFATLANANAFCESKMGAGWRVAEFHDGSNGGSSGAWYFFAYGNVGENYSADQRFWVDVNDQPSGTCWSR